MATRIVEQSIKRLKAPEEGNCIEWDSEIPGCGARITAAGVVSFLLDYYIFGRRRRYTIGRYPDLTASGARDEAIKLRAMIRAGRDPMEERSQSREEPTLGHLATEYRESEAFRRLRPRTGKDYGRMLDKVICPKLGGHRLKAIGRRDIEKFHASLKETPYQANRVLALLSAMFNYAIEQKQIAENPARGRIQRSERSQLLAAPAAHGFTRRRSTPG